MHREIITCIGKLLLRSSILYFIWQDLIDNLYIYLSIFYGWVRIYIRDRVEKNWMFVFI